MKRPKVLDVFAIVIALGITVLSFVYAYGGNVAAAQVVIKASGEEWIYPLDESVLLEFTGPLGVTTVQIENGGAHVVSSPCREKTCILAGHLDETGEWTACLPNRLFMKISGDDDQPIDEISY